MLYVYFFGFLALLLLIWVVCRTPAGPKREAENRRASQLADKSRNEALFGEHHED